MISKFLLEVVVQFGPPSEPIEIYQQVPKASTNGGVEKSDTVEEAHKEAQ